MRAGWSPREPLARLRLAAAWTALLLLAGCAAGNTLPGSTRSGVVARLAEGDGKGDAGSIGAGSHGAARRSDGLPRGIGLPSAPVSPGDATAIADSVLARLTLRQKIGQLFITPVLGSFNPEHANGWRDLSDRIEAGEVGGLIFMRSDVYGQAMMTNGLQAIAEVPLWITQDMEFGAAMRVQGTTRLPPAMAIAATGSERNAFIAGAITAKEAKALGVHQIFAPVLDVNNNPANPVINVRSYSEDPDLVAAYGIAFMQGVHSEGVIATAKHFPGHGDTDTDSHLDLPFVDHPLERLSNIEMTPFREAIRGGLRSVMSAHVAYTGISENPGLPSTLDASVLRRLLVDSLGFDGIIVTDGLEMKAIAENYAPGRAVVEAFKAGADLMLISPDEPSALHDMEQAVRAGEIPLDALEARVHRILRLKAEHGLFDRRKTAVAVDAANLPTRLATAESLAEARRIARESVVLLKNEGGVLPIRDASAPAIHIVAVGDGRDGSLGSTFLREVRRYHQRATLSVLDARSNSLEREQILTAARDADLVLIASFLATRSGGRSALSTSQRDLLLAIERLANPAVLVSFGDPYLAAELPEGDAVLLAWSGSQEQVEQTAPALFGASAISARLPIRIPGVAETGSGIDMPKTTLRLGFSEDEGVQSDTLRAIDRVMRQAIRDSVFPGGVVAVVRHGTLIWNQAYGYHDYEQLRKVETRDIYDLASITKVMATTTALMKLVEEGRISLDEKVARHLPEFDVPGPRREVTIRHLLTHTSGLPPFRIYVDSLRTRSEILRAVRNEPLVNPPGEKMVYSDLGFILLGEIIETTTGMRLDRYIRSEFFYPMGMVTAHYNPSQVGRWLADLAPPTEFDTLHQRGKVQAGVHDERAWFMDGVAGHAGLFGSTRDMAIWATMLQNGGEYAGRRYLQEETIAEFTSRQHLESGRGYGFDRKSGPNSTAGRWTSDNTYGHLGFTGTSIWTDPDRGITIILLTNRTWPSREKGGTIGAIRRQIADIVMSGVVESGSRTDLRTNTQQALP